MDEFAIDLDNSAGHITTSFARGKLNLGAGAQSASSLAGQLTAGESNGVGNSSQFSISERAGDDCGVNVFESSHFSVPKIKQNQKQIQCRYR